MLRPTDRRVSSRTPCRSSRRAAAWTRGPRWAVATSYHSRSAARWSRTGASSRRIQCVRVAAAHAVRRRARAAPGPRREGRRGSARAAPYSRRLVAAALAAAAALTGAALGARRRGADAPGRRAPAPGRSPSASLNDVDSFNPFLGIEAESYEMWALTYDYMITLLDEGHVAGAGLAESWETSDDGLTWTFHIREGVMWSDGEPLTAADIAYTYNRILDGGREAAPGAPTSTVGHQRRRRPTTPPSCSRWRSRTRSCRCCRSRSCPEHVWKNVDEKDGEELRRPSRPTVSRSSGPGRSGWSRAPPAARRTASRGTPTTGRARPTSTRSSSRSTRRRTRWCRR